ALENEAFLYVTSCCTPGGQGRWGGCIAPRARADGKNPFLLAMLTSFLLFTVGPCKFIDHKSLYK
uniref:Uncharacterized protein n=1 Tax=Otus sunia TaxID=257818 RepID=A0A8C8AUK8_9STRI